MSAFARVYARAVAGIPVAMTFDPNRKWFDLEWLPDRTIVQPTEIFVPQLQYPRGFNVSVSKGFAWTFNKQTSVVYVALKPNSIRVSDSAFARIRPAR